MEINLPLGVPNAKQDIFLNDKHNIVGFGGARGGGKSWAIRTKTKALAFKHPGIKILIIRKSYPELTENHVKPLKKDLMVGTDKALATYNDSKKELRFFNGSEVLFRYLDTEKDLERLQGLETDILFIDEATQLPEVVIKQVMAIVRGTNDFPKRCYLTCNPGGVGHGFIKRIFIDRKYEMGEDPEDYSFTQSLVTDNTYLMEHDAKYIKMLEALPDKIRSAWLLGDWSVYQGAFFSEFRETPDPMLCQEAGITVEEAAREGKFTHVIEPFEIPKDWTIFRSYDWGYGRPFAFTYYALPPGDDTAYCFLEWYGCTGTPNEGIKMTNDQQFKYVQELEHTHRWLKGKKIFGVADPSIWDGSHDTDGISCAEIGERYGIFFDKANNERIAGWNMVRTYFQFSEEGKPRLYFFNTCKHSIRTIPLMMFDEHKVEDMDTSLEDHLCDTHRYFCMARPVAPLEKVAQRRPISDPLNQFTDTKYGKYNNAILYGGIR